MVPKPSKPTKSKSKEKKRVQLLITLAFPGFSFCELFSAVVLESCWGLWCWQFAFVVKVLCVTYFLQSWGSQVTLVALGITRLELGTSCLQSTCSILSHILGLKRKKIFFSCGWEGHNICLCSEAALGKAGEPYSFRVISRSFKREYQTFAPLRKLPNPKKKLLQMTKEGLER